MSDDAFLTLLRSDWHAAVPDAGPILRHMARHRRWRRRVIAANAVAIPMLLACLLWFGVSGLYERDALQGISAIAYAMALPVVVAELRHVVRQSIMMPEPTPLGAIQVERAHAALSRRLLGSARWSAYILGGSAVALWILVFLGAATASSAGPISIAWSATAVAIWVWISRRDTALGRIIANCDTLLAEYRSADQ